MILYVIDSAYFSGERPEVPEGALCYNISSPQENVSSRYEHPEFFIAEKILEQVLQSKIKKVFFYCKASLVSLLIHDFYNLKVEMMIFKETLLTKGSLENLFSLHTQDFLISLDWVEVEGDWFKFSSDIEEITADKYFLVLLNSKTVMAPPQGLILKRGDILLYTQDMASGERFFPLNTTSTQDMSYLLYRPLIRGESAFVIKKELYDSLKEEEKKELFKRPNFFFYQKGLNVMATLLKMKCEKRWEESYGETLEESLFLYSPLLSE